MSHIVTHEIKAEDFRQNYTPEAVFNDSSRHWMLDFGPARDLLKTKLRKSDLSATVPIWGDDENLDAKLNLMIDELGMRDSVKPETKMGLLAATAKFFKMMIRCQIS